MKFPFVGELRVGPLILLLGRSGHHDGRNRNFRFASPVRWFWTDTPDVPRLIQSDAHQPKLTLRAQRDTIRYPGRNAGAARQLVEFYRNSRLQWLREPHPAALRIHY